VIRNGRWRGRMPFRMDHNSRPETYEQQGRTGEPSPASRRRRNFNPAFHPAGYGRAEGSFTERMRDALDEWMKANYGNTMGPITFQYRLSRKKVITVTGMYPVIQHWKEMGRGSKGFRLRLYTTSIDGVVPGSPRNVFALNKIVGNFTQVLTALPTCRKN